MTPITPNKAEERRAFALKVFKDYPGKISTAMQQAILAQQVALGMPPYEAYLAAGAFAFKVKADPANWKSGEDPYKVMWAQSVAPDNSEISMIFENESQYPGEGRVRFQVHFRAGTAAKIEKLDEG